LGALTPLFDWGEVLVITFGEVDHHVLAALWQLSHTLARRAGVSAKSWNNSLRWQDGAIFDIAAVPDRASSPNYTVLPDINVRVHHSRIDDAPLANKDMVSDLQGEKSYAFAELLERRSNHRFAGYHTMPSHSHICQVAPDDRLRLDDVLSIEDDVLRATEDARPRDPVSTRCFYVLRFVKGNVWQLHDA